MHLNVNGSESFCLDIIVCMASIQNRAVFQTSCQNLGVYAYHFWMKHMKPIKRFSGNQYLHKQPQSYRLAFREKWMPTTDLFKPA